jgi:hypothetical protein
MLLSQLMTEKIPVISMAEIHEKYSKATGENSVGEKDLRPDEERWICEYAKEEPWLRSGLCKRVASG